MTGNKKSVVCQVMIIYQIVFCRDVFKTPLFIFYLSHEATPFELVSRLISEI